VAAVSNLGAWTAHFWQTFFQGPQTFFAALVLQFLHNGNPTDPANYQGLPTLMQPGGIFDPARVTWIRVVLMTPHNYINTPGILPWARPINTPLPGQLYPGQVAQISATIQGFFTAANPAVMDVVSITRTYPFDQTIWNWYPEPTINDGQININWHWVLDRGTRRFNDPWVGMMTVQRCATNAAGVTPAVRVWVENAVVMEHNL
jgi:hypothetical protein